MSDVELAPTEVPAEREPRSRRAKRRRRSPRQPLDRGLVIASAVIAVGFSLIIWGFLGAVTGSRDDNRPDAIERLSPVEDAIQVLQQESVIVDLEFGYEGRLVIDGVELETTVLGQTDVDPGELAPGQQLSIPPTAVFDPGNAVLTFTPAEGAAFERFEEGQHTATLIYWRTDQGPERARSYTWTFNVV